MSQISEVADLLCSSQRPVFIWGAGIRPYAEQALYLARRLMVPVATTWAAVDLIHHDDPLMAGGFGTHGTRAANFTVQNADLIVSIGSRLDTKATGHPPHWARAAKVVMVDLDRAELNKFQQLGRAIDIPLCMDAGLFLEQLTAAVTLWADKLAWVRQVHDWRKRYDTPEVTWPGVNPYEFVKEIAKWTTREDTIVSDTGTALGYLMQSFPFKGERMIHAFNMTPMGYGLAASVGAAFAKGTTGRVILVTGDGGIMMSLPELATLARWNLNVKVILFNNGQHSMCVQTERQWFGGKNASTTVESGLGFPNFRDTAAAFDIFDWGSLEDLFSYPGPGLMEVEIHEDAHLIPQARFGKPLEDADPELPRDVLAREMLVPLL
jgi:acetolactate synthase-1/2/3 large subunit